MSDATPSVDPVFLSAVAAVPQTAWATWFADPADVAAQVAPHQQLIAAFAIPRTRGQAALCLFESTSRQGDSVLHQTVLRLWVDDEVPAAARILHADSGATGLTRWTLGDAWAEPGIRAWFREALAAGASLRADGWEWHAAPERTGIGRTGDGHSLQVPGRRHDVLFFSPAAIGVVYRRLTRGGQPEVDLLRHLERLPVRKLAPALLASATLRAPTGHQTASAIIEEIVPNASSLRTVIVSRLRRSLDGDPGLQAAAIEDLRATGALARELHAALGRPFDHGLIHGAEPATERDVDVWVARAWDASESAASAARGVGGPAVDVGESLSKVAGKLQQFAAAAKLEPGLVHRIHGNLTLDAVLIAPPRQLSVIEFDGDLLLSDRERILPSSPFRDVAQLLLSTAEATVEAAVMAGGDDATVDVLWLWEREARKACLEGYGPAGGAMHALLAIFEFEFAARRLTGALLAGRTSDAVAEHALRRLSRTAV